MAPNKWLEIIADLKDGYSYLVFDLEERNFFDILPDHVKMVEENGLFQEVEKYIFFKSKVKFETEE